MSLPSTCWGLKAHTSTLDSLHLSVCVCVCGGGGRVVTSDYKGMARKQEKKRRGLEATITRKPAQFLDLSSGNSFPLAAWGCFQGAGVPGALRHR